MDPIEPDRRIAIQVWWAFMWRSLLISMGIAVLIGIFLGLFASFAGMSRGRLDSLSAFLAPIIGSIVYITVSVEVMRRILKKKFENFKLVIVPREN